MSDHNVTVTPQEARRTSGSRIMRSLEDTQKKRAERYAGVPPVTMFWVGMIRNFILGIPITAYGGIQFHQALTVFNKREGFALNHLYPFIPSLLILSVGMAFLAPSQTEAFFRFLGLGNIIDRLPFLRPRTPETP